ncbi:hypothetical protein EDE15_1543 [Edaphobacter aggregans]|uniref:Uncharacterized protein n=1 Tax=Edaphobacter aggregans TaxID=570835 RepID=A0A3R9NW73_9BACT|nr:hypothetical protein EDE15_1543 [Edaphobacter aggregans]
MLLGLFTFYYYDSGWVAMTREPKANSVRFKLIGLVLLLALFTNMLARIIRPLYRVTAARALLNGILVAVAVCYIGFFFGDRYLGGNAIATPDHSGFYLLMWEGYGMMFPFVCVGFGVLVALREGFEKATSQKREAATGAASLLMLG